MGQVALTVQSKCGCGDGSDKGYQAVPDIEQIQIDQEYFNQQQWYIKEEQKLLISPDKFIFLYFGYKTDQDDMNKHWEKLDIRQTIRHGIFQREDPHEVLALKWKYLMRRGVPMALMRTIILDIFKRTFSENQMEYSIALNIIFKDKVPSTIKSAPMLMNDDRPVEEVVKFKMLSPQGIEALKRILWVLKEMYHQIDYNPMVVQIATLLLIFLKEEEAYCVLKLMIEDSTKLLSNTQNSSGEEERSLRWHLLMKKSDFTRFAKSFFDTVATKSKTFKQILLHFKDIGFDYFELFLDIMNSLFSGYLNFGTVLKIFAMYMNEGIKVYFRFMYALCRIIYKDILNTRDISKMKNLIRQLGMTLKPKQVKDMIKRAFGLRLVKVNQKMQRYSIPDQQQVEMKKIYYIPHLDLESNIISQDQVLNFSHLNIQCNDSISQNRIGIYQLETLWGWLPQVLRLSDGVQVWSTNSDGFSLQNLYKRCENYRDRQMLMIIKADNNSIFGVYCDQMLKPSTTYFGSGETFVFSLEPKAECYDSQADSNQHAYCCPEYFTFGSDNVALMIDSTLNKGKTEPSKTYNSSYLTGNSGKSQFICLELEIYTFE